MRRVRSSPAYQMIRRNITRTRCVQPPKLFDWATDPDLRDWSAEIRQADILQRAGLGDRVVCGRCGKPATGFAMIGDTRYCHPDFGTSCYQAAWQENPERYYPSPVPFRAYPGTSSERGS